MAQFLSAALVVVILLGIHVYLMSIALGDLNQPNRRVRGYDKSVWALVIAFVGIFGPIAYLRYGRDERW